MQLHLDNGTGWVVVVVVAIGKWSKRGERGHGPGKGNGEGNQRRAQRKRNQIRRGHVMLNYNTLATLGLQPFQTEYQTRFKSIQISSWSAPHPHNPAYPRRLAPGRHPPVTHYTSPPSTSNSLLLSTRACLFVSFYSLFSLFLSPNVRIPTGAARRSAA
jgi:hypothetical protein